MISSTLRAGLVAVALIPVGLTAQPATAVPGAPRPMASSAVVVEASGFGGAFVAGRSHAGRAFAANGIAADLQVPLSNAPLAGVRLAAWGRGAVWSHVGVDVAGATALGADVARSSAGSEGGRPLTTYAAADEQESARVAVLAARALVRVQLLAGAEALVRRWPAARQMEIAVAAGAARVAVSSPTLRAIGAADPAFGLALGATVRVPVWRSLLLELGGERYATRDGAVTFGVRLPVAQVARARRAASAPTTASAPAAAPATSNTHPFQGDFGWRFCCLCSASTRLVATVRWTSARGA